MKLVLAGVLMAALPAFAFAVDSSFGLGFSVAVNNLNLSQTGASDYQASSSTLGLFAVVPLDETWETDFGVALEQRSIKDLEPLVQLDPTDYSQSGATASLAFYASLATMGPFTLRSGVSAGLTYFDKPKNYDGFYSYYAASFGLPVILDVAFAERWNVRIELPVVVGFLSSEEDDTATYGQGSLQINAGGLPSVALYYMF